jgi:hypothetical protein
VERGDMDSQAYFKGDKIPFYAYNAVAHMMNVNEDIWKLLKYNDSDCLNKPNLTMSEKAALIYKGEPDESIFRLFLADGEINAFISEATVMRIFTYSIYPENRTASTVTLAFDLFTHFRVSHLNDYSTRTERMTQIVLEVFNGEMIPDVGQMFFDVMGNKEIRDYGQGQIPFKGKRLLLSFKTG